MKKLVTLLAAFALLGDVAVGQNFSLNFDGTDDLVNAGDSIILDMNATMTLEAWVYPVAYAGVDVSVVLNKEGEYELGIWNDGEIMWAFANSSPGWIWSGTGITANINSWNHIAIVYKPDSIISYVNGVLIDKTVASGLINDVELTYNDLYIGNRQKYIASNEPFTGNIDEVRIWNIARTSSEIASTWNSELTGNENGLIVYYKMDEVGSPNDVVDCSPNLLHGSRQGNTGTNNLPQFTNAVPSITDVLCGGVSISEIDNNAYLSIYPNPSTGKFTVQGATGEIQVYDLFGRLVLSSQEPQIDMRGYAKGMYVVKLVSNEETYIQKLILE